MATQVIYARVPEDIKAAADTYASERDISLTAAVVELLDQGLRASAAGESPDELRLRLARTDADNAQLAADLRAATAELGTLRALSERAGSPIGSCSNCAHLLTGYDLLAAGRCAHCDTTLPDIWTLATGRPNPAATQAASSFNDRDLLLLLGAVGAVVGAAYLISRST